MPYQNIPRYQSPYGNRYGFRQRTTAPAHAPYNAAIPNAPTSVGTSVQAEEQYHSGPSAENETIDTTNQSDGGGDSSPPAGGASYDSYNEALQAGLAGYDAGYYGTVQDARYQAAQGNQRAQDALGNFVNRSNQNPVSLGPRAPGLLGLAAYHAGIGQNEHGGATPNQVDAIRGLEESGALYSDDNSSGYQGDSLQEQQNRSDIHAATVYGDWSSWGQEPEVGTPAPTVGPISGNAAQGFTGNNAQQIAQDHGIAEHSAAPGTATHDAISGIGYSPTGAAPAGSQFSSTGTFSSAPPAPTPEPPAPVATPTPRPDVVAEQARAAEAERAREAAAAQERAAAAAQALAEREAAARAEQERAAARAAELARQQREQQNQSNNDEHGGFSHGGGSQGGAAHGGGYGGYADDAGASNDGGGGGGK